MNHQEVIRKMVESGWNKGDAKAFEECIAADAQVHDPTVPNAQPGPSTVMGQMKLYRGAFPDMRMTIDQQLVDGDCVVTRWTCRGTHSAPLMGSPATNRKITVTGIQIDRFRGDKIVESWVNWDTSGMLQQIGLMPQMTAPTSGAAVGRTPAVHK